LSSTTSARRVISSAGTFRLLAEPQPEPRREAEGTALAGRALQPDLPAHQLDQAARDGQAEAGAAVLARGGHVRLRERLEQPGHLLLAHADAGVAHREAQLRLVPGALQHLRLQPDLALRRELDRVVDEVGQDLAEAQRVAQQVVRDSVGNVHQEFQPLLVGLFSGDHRHLLDHLVEGEVGRLDVEPPGPRSWRSPGCR
jgi:hypothetical protein